ncbi:hypothetical protein GCM10018779_44630 [Streptomyces griseocarneus]|nr:hypothetical protein GCM10018779_44630 [Streptomyces griseocarneus]
MASPISPPPPPPSSGSASPILPKPVSGLIIASDFEWKSHEELCAMYAWSAHQLSVAPRPTFRPMPADMPGLVGDKVEYLPNPGAVTQPGFAGPHSGSASPLGYEAGSPGAGAGADMTVAPGKLPEARTTPVEVAGGVVAPQAPSAAGGITTPPPYTGGVADRLPAPATPAVPPLPPIGRTGPVWCGGPKGPAATPRRPVTDLPGRGLVGGRVNVPAPGAPAGGIVGGRPVPRTSAQNPTQLPRGTVIGTESSRGRQQAGFVPGSGAMPGAPAGRSGSGSSGRRLATERGGVVGGRRQRTGADSDRVFIPGGAGLVRGPSDSERARNTNRPRQRPDYLVEDEEAWSHNNRRAVPPVID